MAKPSFKRALLRADERFARLEPSPELDLRMLEHFGSRRRAGARRVLAAAAAGLAIAAAAVVLAQLRSGSSSADARAAGFRINMASDDFDYAVNAASGLEVRSGRCELLDDDHRARLSAGRGARVRKEPTGLRVVRGEVTIEVEPRGPGDAPVQVFVSHGRFDVLGTRFAIEQRGDHGVVELFEGTLRFVAADGRERRIRAGDRLRWPLPEAEPRERAPRASDRDPIAPEHPESLHADEVSPRRAAARAAGRATAPPFDPASNASGATAEPDAGAPAGGASDARAVLTRLEELRSRGRYREAVEWLQDLSTDDAWSPTFREQLSFELGLLLSDHLRDRERSCQHWRAHHRAYPHGQYLSDVERVEARVGCREVP